VAVKVAHMRLCHSRMMFRRAYPRETQGMVFDERAFGASVSRTNAAKIDDLALISTPDGANWAP
jgi:hypothetical protein